MVDKFRKKIGKLPQSPGVYFFKDSSGNILYIGKATNLKNRVSSYFSGKIENRLVHHAIGQIKKIEIMEADSVLEALILESNLIKKYQPKYNVDLKDDKSFSYAVITKEEFPRVIILRETELADNKNIIKHNFGPYTSRKQLETALKIIRKIFPYHSNKQQTEKGCLDYQIGLCPGPFMNAIGREDYLKNIRNIRMILEGEKKNLIKKLEREMKDYSKKHEFEKAAETRNRIFALKHIRDIALVSRGDENLKLKTKNSKFLRIEAYDISNISGQYAVGSMVVFKNDEPDKSQYRKFKIKTIQGSDDVGMMREILMRRFNNNWPKPDLILLDGGRGHLNMYDKLMRGLKLEIPAIAIAKGPTRKISDFQFLISNQILPPKQNPAKAVAITKFPKNLLSIINDRNLLSRIISEAHRFAIRYHKKLRKTNFI